MNNTRNQYTKEELQTDINWLCEDSNHPLTEQEAEDFILGLLNKELVE